MSIKLWFNEVTNYDDGTYYQKLADRFAPLMMTVVRHRQLARKGLIAAALAKTP